MVPPPRSGGEEQEGLSLPENLVGDLCVWQFENVQARNSRSSTCREKFADRPMRRLRVDERIVVPLSGDDDEARARDPAGQHPPMNSHARFQTHRDGPPRLRPSPKSARECP